MSRKGKHYVLGYYVLKGGKPCILNLSLHAAGLLVPSADGQALSPFKRGLQTLWSAKLRAARAIRRTERVIKRIDQASHLDFAHIIDELRKPGLFTLHPLRNLHPELKAQTISKPTTKSQRRAAVINDI